MRSVMLVLLLSSYPIWHTKILYTLRIWGNFHHSPWYPWRCMGYPDLIKYFKQLRHAMLRKILEQVIRYPRGTRANIFVTVQSTIEVLIEWSQCYKHQQVLHLERRDVLLLWLFWWVENTGCTCGQCSCVGSFYPLNWQFPLVGQVSALRGGDWGIWLANFFLWRSLTVFQASVEGCGWPSIHLKVLLHSPTAGW